ncbi:MAG: hypothetical protein IK138_07200 [Lachnospiraceae bacterium]|nr:hypothetical protein [Lachnospiraceae bacterium]
MAKTKEQNKALKKQDLKTRRKKRSGWFRYLLIALLVIGATYLTYYLIRYSFYDHYRDYLTDYTVEEGTDFKAAPDSNVSVEGYALAAESDFLKLYVQTDTGNIAVYDKRNGETVYSNPPGADEDGIANVTNKAYLKSQLILDYYNTQRMENTFDSYSQAVQLGQLNAQSIKNGVRIIYTFGDTTAATGIVPIYINKDVLEDVLSKMDNAAEKFSRKKFIQSDEDENLMVMLENTRKGVSQVRRLNEYFTAAGWTKEDYEREMSAVDVEGAVPITFKVPIDYTINDDYLEASVYMKGVEENGGGAIHDIQMLNFFGAAGKDETGYLLVPNGSGSIIGFNNGKGTARSGNDYSEYIYGIDPMVADYTVREKTLSAKLSLFGIFRENSGILATIESGASLANVSASVAGDVNEYNNVYTTFILRGNDTLAMFGTTGSEAKLPIVETDYYDTPLTVRYTLLTAENPGFAGAANYYRERLIREGRLKASSTETDDIKLYYDVIGGVEETKYFLGTQYRGLTAMTTFEEAAQLANDLKASGVTKQVMNLQGWSGGGYYHDTLGKIKVPGKLGGETGLEELSDALLARNGTLYVDCAFQKVSEVSDRYSASNETSRYYGTGYIGEFGEVHPGTLRQTASLGYDENIYYLISPKFLVRYTENFAEKIGDIGVSGISLRDLGNELHSDKRRTNVINREEALQVVKAQLQKMKDTGKNVMINSGNDYSFTYADDILNAPLTDNAYPVADAAVPFYEMLIHGCIEYSGTAINLSNTTDIDEIILSLVERGASPHFTFTKEASTEMKMTGLNKFYSTSYDSWKETAVNIWNGVNDALSKVNGAYMTDFRQISEGVSVTTYSNGTKIYVNHTDTAATADRITVAARSYAIGG